MHHDYAFDRGHNPYNENSFENKKLSTYVLNVAFNIYSSVPDVIFLQAPEFSG